MYPEDKKDTLVQIYEVAPVIEAAQPKPRRPLWRKVLGVFFIFLTIITVNNAFSIFGCSRSRSSSSNSPIYNTVVEPIKHVRFDFPKEITDFKIKQVTQSLTPTRTKVFGQIYVGSCPKAEGISVHAEISASDTSLIDKVRFDQKDWGLRFSGDVFSGLVKQWVNITAYVVVPISDQYKIATFQVETRELDIILLKSFKSKINGTYFETMAGNINHRGQDPTDFIHSPYLSAKTLNGHIHGRFGLGHTLDFESASGNIGVNITSADWNGVPGTLKTITGTGKNRVDFGSIIHPRPLYTKHRSISGTIDVHYPEDWQGNLTMATVTGQLHLMGEGTQIVKKGQDVNGKFFKVLKGSGGTARASIGSVSGNVWVRVGWKKGEDDQYISA